ncbi:MAG TPA: RluA family pseudouridine synthase, partial [Pyrinomonadaceae bacterium]|nr:RluA family pseudouridine synthase [Pyrinomonadaceae bacterium]
MEADAPAQETSTLAFSAAADDIGARLDSYLTARIPDWSRSRIQRLIEDGDVLVNGRTSKASYKLRLGDEVEVELNVLSTSEFTPEEIPLDVVYEDDELIVINKPAGLIVHPAAGVSSGTLANALAYRFRIADFGMRVEEEHGESPSESSDGKAQTKNPPSAFRNPQSVRPGIVHRLDKDTSGLMVVAKTES